MEHLNLIISLLGIALSAGVAWGITSAKIKETENRLNVLSATYSKDHDLLVEIKTKLDMLLKGRVK
jgi:hypothetical protein